MCYLVTWHWNYLTLSWTKYYISIVSRHDLSPLAYYNTSLTGNLT